MKKDQEKSLSYEEQIKIAHESFVSFDQHIISKLLDRDKNIHIDGNYNNDTFLFSEAKSVLENLAKRRMETKSDKR
jgi:hypothetical protein